MDEGDNGPGAEYNVYPKEFSPVYDARRKLVGKQLYTLLGVPRGDAAGMLKQFRKNYDFFDAPVGLIFTIDRVMGTGSLLDYGMFLQNVMVAARARGLDTCAQAAFTQFHRVIEDQLGLAPNQMVLCGMSLGHADPDKIDAIATIKARGDLVNQF